jgi:hypothetical protein
VIPWLVGVVDRVYSEDVSRDFDRLCQGVSENVESFFPKFQKLVDLLKIFNPLTEEDEREYFFQKLRPQLQRELKSHNKIYASLGADLLIPIVDIYSLAKTLEESKGLIRKQVNFANKFKSARNRGGASQNKIAEDLQRQITVLRKKLEERAPSVKFKGNCFNCGESGHKKSVCINAKKINAVSKYSVV